MARTDVICLEAVPDTSFEKPKCERGKHATDDDISEYRSLLQQWCSSRLQAEAEERAAQSRTTRGSRISNQYWATCLDAALYLGTGRGLAAFLPASRPMALGLHERRYWVDDAALRPGQGIVGRRRACIYNSLTSETHVELPNYDVVGAVQCS